MMRACIRWAAIALFVWMTGFRALPVEAKTIFDSPYVTFSSDGKAWTANAGDPGIAWYADDGTDDVVTGIASSLRELRTGEHYYQYDRRGAVPVGKWKVCLSRANCCHRIYWEEVNYHNIPYVGETCLKPHFSGWAAACADCGERITDGYIYMSKSAAESIHYLEMRDGLSYYYLCPFNRNLEQALRTERHICRRISANRYRVEYLPNTEAGTYEGDMAPSYHIYNNGSEYDGKAVTPQIRLNKNTYSRIGWRFVGWNTERDGTGSFYGDEAEIYNLCAGDYLRDKAAGNIILYAMWEKASGILEIDPAGGSYLGDYGITEISRKYGTVYRPDPAAVYAPAGYSVRFEVNGGEEVSTITGSRRFVGWERTGDFEGAWEDNCYCFSGADDSRDRIRAVYADDPVVLPRPHKEGALFGGWFYDRYFLDPAGEAGDTIIPAADTTLYAQWVEFYLRVTDNHSANSGKGAVDLRWSQADEYSKVYKIYQSTDAKYWRKIISNSEVSDNRVSEILYGYSGSTQHYTVPYSGFYRLTASGAQGGNYMGYTGGYGGEASGVFWLAEGETLQITVGGQNGFNGGGIGEMYACGGGYTDVRSDRRGLLIVAGGGGGASSSGRGCDGGAQKGLLDYGMLGQKGISGGGGGYRGGQAGREEADKFENACGGSSYVTIGLAKPYAYSAGVREGDGRVLLTTVDVGYQTGHSFTGVTASDTAAPDPIDLNGVKKTAAGEGRIKISWSAPADNGTPYYYRAETYWAGNAERQGISNITRNIAISGITGYYYCIDRSATTQVNAGTGKFIAESQEIVDLTEEDRYFHVTAVDAARNRSQTVHIPIGSLISGDSDVAWPLYTEQLIPERDEHVYADPTEKIYYIKSDGKTPFTLNCKAYIQGPASEDYQLNYAVFQTMDADGRQARNKVMVPNGEQGADAVRFFTEGASCLQADSCMRAVRSGRGKELSVAQRYILEESQNGRPIRIVPMAGADFKGKIIWSDREADAENGLWIIGDGEAPVIHGNEHLENLQLIDRRKGTVKLRLSATDVLSGLRELKLRAKNTDNDAEREWKCDEEGVLEVNITDDEPVFSGDFTIEIYACDNVGNDTAMTYSVTEFDLQAKIERFTTPFSSIFKRGESGMLRITTWGYADRVEIEFPQELVNLDAALNHVYLYDLKQHYEQEEVFEFRIPLSAAENVRYQITVKAYKGEKMLEQYPAFSTIGIEGSVLDELHTRLR